MEHRHTNCPVKRLSGSVWELTFTRIEPEGTTRIHAGAHVIQLEYGSEGSKSFVLQLQACKAAESTAEARSNGVGIFGRTMV